VRDEYREAGRQALFDQLKGCLTGDTDTPYQEIGRRLEMSEGAVKVAVHRLRRRFRDALTNEIADTVSDPAEIQAELEYLLKAVSA
jgi:RNA polymerase sigma-70 factor (ECF subfamily)